MVFAQRNRHRRGRLAARDRKVGRARRRPRERRLGAGRIDRDVRHRNIGVVAVAGIDMNRVCDVEPVHRAIVGEDERLRGEAVDEVAARRQMRRGVEPQLERHLRAGRRDLQHVVRLAGVDLRAQRRDVGAARVWRPQRVALEIRLVELARTIAVAALIPHQVRAVAAPLYLAVVAVERHERRERRRLGKAAVAHVDVLHHRACQSDCRDVLVEPNRRDRRERGDVDRLTRRCDELRDARIRRGGAHRRGRTDDRGGNAGGGIT